MKVVCVMGAVVVLLLYLLGTYYKIKENPDYVKQLVAKVAGTLISLIIVISNIRGMEDQRVWWGFGVVLLFCLIGDILLGIEPMVFDPETKGALMLGGIGSFFAGYLWLAIMLLSKGIPGKNIIVVTVILVASVIIGIMQYKLMENLGDMKIPVIAYIVITTLLLTGSSLSYDISGWFLLTGLMFYVSDSIIGHKLFGSLNGKDLAEIPIVLTYGIGQAGLIMGTYFLSKNNLTSLTI